MDKGAHYHKSDFQVHSPRDLNWTGQDAVTPDERKLYADELIRACRQKCLEAIAITDHHDFAFFPHVKKAAEGELDDTGKAIEVEKRIVVFPGLELTLAAPPCQALLILDASFPENLLPGILATLAITPSPSEESKHAPVIPIPSTVSSDFKELYEKLNNLDYVKGRFTIFPHVTDGGHKTLLRPGFADYYKSMPCVGGYVESPIGNLGQGNRTIISGEDRNYGFKRIAVIQTSDNRKRTHEDLGRHSTWIKWSEPTAEALRQACLAQESRTSHSEPELPSLWITSVSVTNSKFLGRVVLELNQQYNAIIGGRGTGKSTILEYLRWGLCDQPVESAESDVALVQTKRKQLIDDTLQKFDGEVHVTFLLNEVQHIVKRNSKSQEILLKIGNGDFAQTTEQDIRNLLPIQAYSQKQLSSVGVRIEELKRFVELPIKKTFDQIRSDIRDTVAKIRVAYSQLIRKREVLSEVSKYNLEVTSLTQQVETMRASLTGLTPEDQAIINQKPKYDNEERIVEGLKNELARMRDLVTSVQSQLAGEAPTEEVAELENTQLIADIRTRFGGRFADVRTQVSTLSNLFSAQSLLDITQKVEEWQKLKSEFDKKYEAAKARASVNQQKLKGIQDTEKRIADLRKLQMDNRNTLTALGDPETIYADLKARSDSLHKQKIQSLDGQCQQFSSLSNGLIKAEIARSLDVGLLKQKVKSAFAGMNVRDQKIDDLCQTILTAADPLGSWNAALIELEKLASHNTSGTDPIPATPIFDSCGLTGSERTRIATNFDSSRWLELSVTELEFNPVFRYCTNQTTNEYIEFAVASAGQQATALLTVLLNQPGAPLIIDQPEDDVDSKLVKNIIEQIWKAKSKRQLIFASHNANFVVNGDAELVVCCDYVSAGNQTGGQIKYTGAIDNTQIKEEITVVTEGGKQAFKLRMEKYGF